MDNPSEPSRDEKGGHYIYRASKRLPDGKVIFARQYGKRAFKIWVPAEKKPEK